MRVLGLAAVTLALSGCGGGERPPLARGVVTADWRQVATPGDRSRLHKWRTAFMEAIGAAKAAGRTPEIVREGALFQPDAALPGPDLPSGRYKCRTIKLGSQRGMNGLAYVAYPFFECLIADEGEVASFTKATGSQRPVGLIFSDGERRNVFLGTLMLGDETSAMDYGMDATRDMTGVVERIGDRRWRLVLPYPRFESTLDLIEIVPN